MEDVFEQIRSQTYIPVTLDELNRTPQACLQAFDHLLRQTEESQNAARAKEAEAQDKVRVELVDSKKRFTVVE